MKKQLFTVAISLLLTSYGAAASNIGATSPATSSKLNSVKTFIENKGQILNQDQKPNPACLFLYPGKDLNLQLRKTGFSYDLTRREEIVEVKAASNRPVAKSLGMENVKKYNYFFHRVDIEFVGGNRNAELVKAGQSADYMNYYTSGSGENGILNVYKYNTVTYKNIYPNIDAEFTFEGGEPKYNFIVRAGGNVGDIQLKYEGASSVELQSNGQLLIKTTSGDVTENIPMSFIASSRKTVNVKYAFNNNVVSFVAADYDRTQALIIDPVPNRTWATYYGGNDDESTTNGVVGDGSGNVYCTGWSNSFNNIATNGAHQAFNNGGFNVFDAVVAKFNSNGQIVWGTYYGGIDGEVASMIDRDANGNLFVGGHTVSSTDIATPGAYKTVYNNTLEGFLVKFNSNGVRQFGTYFGGSDDEATYGLVVDGNNDVYLSGYTYSSDGIATNGAFQVNYNVGYTDAFLIKFSNSGSRLWGTYYGDLDEEHGFGITTDNSNNVYMTGECWPANNLLATNGAYQTSHYGGGVDGFLVKFNSAGARQWGTYFGGVTGYDVASDVAFDGNNGIYLTGYTNGDDHISTNGAYQVQRAGMVDGYLAKFTTSGSLSWCTYYGGTNDEYDSFSNQNAVGTDGSGDAYVVGPTLSTNGIASAGAHQQNYGGGLSDGYIIKFNSSGTYQWGTYYGSTGEDYFLDVNVDAAGVCNVGGRTDSPSGIASGGVYQNSFGGGFTDGFLARFDLAAGVAPTSYYTINANPICAGSCINFFEGSFDNPSSWSWNFPGGSPSFSNSQNPGSICFYTPGVYHTTLTVTNAFGSSTSYIDLYVDPAPPVSASSNVNNVCPGTSVTLSANGANNYVWQPGNMVGQSVVVNPNATTTYTVSGTDANGCTGIAQVTVNVVNGNLNVGAFANPNNVCAGTQVTLSASGANSYVWQPGNMVGQTVVVNPNISTTYTVTGTTGGCTGTSQVTVNIVPGPSINVFGNTTICPGTSTTLSANGANSYIWQPGNISGQNIVVSPNVTTTYTVTGTVGGCSGSTQVTVTVLPAPSINISGNTNICPGGTTTLSANGANTYVWQPGNLSGSSVTVSPNVTTTYTVTGVDVNGCLGSSSITVVVGFPTVTISGNLSICQGATTTLSAFGANTYVWQPGNVVGQSITVTPNVTTTYSVTGTVGAGCTNTASVTVVVNPAPPVPVITQNGNVLTSSVPTGNQWYVNGNLMPGATGQSITITSNGVYKVCVTNAFGCSSCSPDFLVNNVGIADLLFEKSISIFPNPFNESITVKVAGTPHETTVQLTDVLGQEIGSWQPVNGQVVMNTGKLPVGVYFVTVRSANKVITQKAVKY